MKVTEFQVKQADGSIQDLSAHKGKVLLIVNTASKCGFTPQYEGLEKLHQEYADKGLEILAFPCNQFGNQEPGDADEPCAPEAEVPRGTETVLVVDDQEIPLNLLCDVLRSLGYTTLPAASGEEAIEILRYAPDKVDLVIVDRIMPGMDGVESLARLRAIRPTLRTILCSGTSEAERTPAGAVPDGFDDFLQKPYERETLAFKVRSVLDGRLSNI